MSVIHGHIRLVLAICILLLGAVWGVHQAGGQTSFPVRITNAASGTFVYKSGQSGATQSNSTETTVLMPVPLASTLLLSATPRALIGNGTDSSLVVATVLDSTGIPVPDGAVVMFVTRRGRFENLNDTITVLTANGSAITTLRSAVVSGDTSSALIEATTAGVSGTVLVQYVSVVFYPAAITGRVASAMSGASVAGAIAVALNQSGIEVGRDTTGAGGRYLIPVNATGVYSIVVSTVDEFGDLVQAVSSLQVTVPASGGFQPLVPWNAVAGTIVDAVSGLPVRQAGIRVSINRLSGKNSPGSLTIPAERMTDARGVFVFDSLAPGSYEIRTLHPLYPGVVVLSDTTPGSFLVSSNIGTTASSALEVTKTSNKRIAEIGDALSYTVTLLNTAQSQPLMNMTVVDDLPPAFVYAQGSSRLDGVPLSEPSIDQNRLTWFLPDSTGTGQSRVLSYRVSLGAGALQSNGVNRVYAAARTFDGDSILSAEASVQVTVRAGVFTDRGIVIGKVFFDENGDGDQDRRETGIEGVELWMEDGTRIVTGDDGKFSLPEVRPGQHVIRIHESTLPTGSRLRAPSTAFAGDGSTRFIRLVEGGIERADFHVTPPDQARLRIGFYRSGSPTGGGLHAVYIIRWRDVGDVRRMVLTDTLPSGFSYDPEGAMPAGVVERGDTTTGNILHLVLASRPSNTIDTLIVPFHAEQITPGVRIKNRAKIILSYARRRDAEIRGRMIPFAPPLTDFANSESIPQSAGASASVPSEVKLPDTPPPSEADSAVELVDAHRAWWLNYVIDHNNDKGYEIQVSSWKTKRKANYEASRIGAKGHNTMVIESIHPQFGRQQHVKVRWFKTRDETRLNAYMVSVAELDTLPYGEAYTIVIDYHTGWGYAIQVLKCESQAQADAEAAQFRRAGYEASVVSFTDEDNRAWHKVLVGRYRTQLSAVEAAEVLKLPRDKGNVAKTEIGTP